MHNRHDAKWFVHFDTLRYLVDIAKENETHGYMVVHVQAP